MRKALRGVVGTVVSFLLAVLYGVVAFWVAVKTEGPPGPFVGIGISVGFLVGIYSANYVLDRRYPVVTWHPAWFPRQWFVRAYAAAFVGYRVFMLTVLFVLGGFVFWAMYELLNYVYESAKSFFNVADPQLSASVIVVIGGVLAAIVTLFGQRWAEARYAAREGQRASQRPAYLQLSRLLTRVRRGTISPEETIATLDELHEELAHTASANVLKSMSEVMVCLKSAGFQPHADPAKTTECEKLIHALKAAMREDLGLSTDPEAAPWLWRNLDPLDARREEDEPVPFVERVSKSITLK